MRNRFFSATSAGRFVLTALTSLTLITSATCGDKNGGNGPPPAHEVTAWEKVMSLAGDKGEHNVTMALQAFAMVYGPLPGVTVPSGAATEIRSATAANRLVLAHWNELTPPQREEITSLSGIKPAVAAGTGKLGRSRSRIVAPTAGCDPSAKNPTRPADQKTVKEAVKLAGEFQRLLPSVRLDPYHLTICEADRDLPADAKGNRAVGGAAPYYNGDAIECPITIYPRGKGPGLATTMAHEIAHCFVHRMAGSDANNWLLPLWIDEGFPEWAGVQVGRGASTWWSIALDPQISLMRRSYDAIGFYTHLQDVRGDVWATIPDIVTKTIEKKITDGWAGFEAAVKTDRDTVLNSLPSSFARQTGRGSPIGRGIGPWDLAGVNIFGFANIDRGLALRNDGPDSLIRLPWKPFASRLSEIYLHAEVITLAPEPGTRVYGRFGPGPASDFVLAEAITKTFCAKSEGCSCKDDPNPTSFTRIDPGVSYLAGYETSVFMRGISLDEFCKKKLKKVPESAKGSVPTICPGVGVITKGFPRPSNGGPWEFDGDIIPPHRLPAGWKTCGYSAWLGPIDPVTRFQQVEQVQISLIPDPETMPSTARQVTIPGTDQAWFDGILKVTVGGRMLAVGLRIRTTEDQDATTIAVAKAVLGVG